MAWVIGPQAWQLSLCSVALGCQDTSLSMLHPVLDLALPAGKWAGEDKVLVGGVGVMLKDRRSRDALTCSNTTPSGIASSAWRPRRCSGHSGASLEPLPLARLACRSQPTWEKGSGRRGWAWSGGASLPTSMPSACLPPWVPAWQTSPSRLQPQVLLRGAEHMLQLMLGDSLPLASVLPL